MYPAVMPHYLQEWRKEGRPKGAWLPVTFVFQNLASAVLPRSSVALQTSRSKHVSGVDRTLRREAESVRLELMNTSWSSVPCVQ